MDIRDKEILVWQVSSVSLALKRHLTLEEFCYIKKNWAEFVDHTSEYENSIVIEMVLQDLNEMLKKKMERNGQNENN